LTRVSTEEIRFVLGLNRPDACRIHNLGRRVLDAMTQLGWTKATKNIRCHKQGQEGQPVAGYFRPAHSPDEPAEALAEPAKKGEDVGAEIDALVVAMKGREKRQRQ
jgi:hypothetical protein